MFLLVLKKGDIVLIVFLIVGLCAFFWGISKFQVGLQPAEVQAKEEEKLYWVKEASVVKVEEVVQGVYDACSLTVEKENADKKVEQVTFFMHKRVCAKFNENTITKVDVAYDGSLQAKKLYFYLFDERIEYE